jgi:osmotically-inducible protein OsmY
LQGIVSRHDLLKLYQQPDEEIRHQLLRALRRQRPTPGARLRVEVSAGHVTVLGEPPNLSLVAEAIGLAERTPGVIDVNGSMVAELDTADRSVVDLS